MPLASHQNRYARDGLILTAEVYVDRPDDPARRMKDGRCTVVLERRDASDSAAQPDRSLLLEAVAALGWPSPPDDEQTQVVRLRAWASQAGAGRAPGAWPQPMSRLPVWRVLPPLRSLVPEGRLFEHAKPDSLSIPGTAYARVSQRSKNLDGGGLALHMNLGPFPSCYLDGLVPQRRQPTPLQGLVWATSWPGDDPIPPLSRKKSACGCWDRG